MLAKFACSAGILFALCAVLLVPAQAQADELANVDQAINRWKTLHYRYQITTGSKVLVLDVRMMQNSPDNLQLVRIESPSDMAGTKVLVKSTTEMYIYMPSFKKIRRVASHFNEQGFLGTALAAEQLALTRYGHLYNSTKTSEDAEHVTLTLTKKSDAAPFPKLEMKIVKAHWVPREIKYFSDAGTLVKSEARNKYECRDSYCVPREMVITDHTKGLTSTLILGKNWKRNPPGISVDLFTNRTLLE